MENREYDETCSLLDNLENELKSMTQEWRDKEISENDNTNLYKQIPLNDEDLEYIINLIKKDTD